MAQEARLEVVIDYVAGSTLYIAAGTDSGITANDTLRVSKEQQGEAIGSLRVIGSTRNRSVLTFSGQPFPITRGDVLFIENLGGGLVSVEPITVTVKRSRPGKNPPNVSGRFLVDYNSFQSTTRWGVGDDQQSDRQFSTPSARLRTTITDLPGGLRLNTNVRGSRRNDDSGRIDPVTLVRVYQANIEKSFETIPLQFALGRFYNPYESYSGYWDGGRLHIGEGGLGGGIAAGFQPKRQNGGFSTKIPQYTAFIDYEYRGEEVRYDTDVSFHIVRPKSEFRNRNFVGWSQHIRWQGLRISQDLQLDRDATTSAWDLGRLRVDVTAPVGGGVYLRAGYGRRQPSPLLEEDETPSFRRDGFSGGVSYNGPKAAVAVDVAANRIDEDERSYAYSASFRIPRLVLGLGVGSSASYWKDGANRVLSVTPNLSRSFAWLHARGSYRFYQSDGDRDSVRSHATDVSLSFPLGHGLNYTFRARRQWGENTTSNLLYTSLWVSF